MVEMRILRMRPITVLKKDKLESQSGSRVGQFSDIWVRSEKIGKERSEVEVHF